MQPAEQNPALDMITIEVIKEDEPDILFTFFIPPEQTPLVTTNQIAEKLTSAAYRHCVLITKVYAFMNYLSKIDQHTIMASSTIPFNRPGHQHQFIVKRIAK